MIVDVPSARGGLSNDQNQIETANKSNFFYNSTTSKLRNFKTKRQATGGANPFLQLSPVFHTSMLYWAAKFDSQDPKAIEEDI
jgi:hypothetical protein